MLDKSSPPDPRDKCANAMRSYPQAVNNFLRFPLGSITKDATRKIAAELNFLPYRDSSYAQNELIQESRLEIVKILNSLGPRSLGILGKMLKAVLY